MVRVPDTKSDCSRRGEAEVRILKFKTPWSEFHHLPRVGPKQLCALAHLGCTCAACTSQLSLFLFQFLIHTQIVGIISPLKRLFDRRYFLSLFSRAYKKYSILDEFVILKVLKKGFNQQSLQLPLGLTLLLHILPCYESHWSGSLTPPTRPAMDTH